MSGLSLNDFKNLLRDEVEKIAKDKQLNIDNLKDRSDCLNTWIASFYKNNYKYIDTDPEDAHLGGTKDLKIDLYLEDQTNKIIYLIQGEYLALGRKSRDIDEAKVESFLGNHYNLINSKWIRDHGNHYAIELLIDYKKLIEKQGFQFKYIFISTGSASDRIMQIADKWNKKYIKEDLSIECEILDISKLKTEYVTAQSLEETIPDEVQFDIQKDKFFLKDDPNPTVIASVKGNILKALWKQEKDSLFAYNIRTYLGEKGINKDIVETAETEPQNFFYYNNGVSAVCTDLKVNKNKIIAKKFQIINGAQTVGSLKKIEDKDDLEVLLRITQTSSKSKSKINEKIIEYNNTQNKITLSDFRSNDPIQLDIQNKFKKFSCENLNKVNYLRKRGDRISRKGELNLKIEDMAKFRYAFLHDPCLVISSAKDLWKIGENGRYTTAFGKEKSELLTDNMFENTYILPIILHERVILNCKKRAEEMDELKYLKRFRFHFLYFFNKVINYIDDNKSQKVNKRKLINKKDYLNNFFEAIFDIIYDQITELVDDIQTDQKEQGIIQNAPIRDLTINRTQRDKLYNRIEKKLVRKNFDFLD